MPASIDRDEVRRLIAEEDGQLVEVLPAGDYEQEHITGAINIPLKEVDDRAPPVLRVLPTFDKAVILEVRKVGHRVKIILSRTHPDFVRRLFENESVRTALLVDGPLICGSEFLPSPPGVTRIRYTSYWGDLKGTHYAALDQINTSNVKNLQAKWAVPLPGIFAGRSMMGSGVIELRRLREAQGAVHQPAVLRPLLA